MEEPEWFKQNQLLAEQNLQSWRRQIDSLDEQISLLLAARLQAARALTGIKAQLQMPTHDHNREAQILQKLRHNAADDHEIGSALQCIYRSIFNQSRNLQEHQAQLNSSSTEIDFPQVMVIGLGLIGGSLARHIKACLPQTTVIGVDCLPVLEQALKQQVIDAGHEQAQPHLSKADLLILAASPDQNLQILQELAPHLQTGQLVLDVSSCKLPICKLADELNFQGANFVGGHPLFGSEKSGFQAGLELNLQDKIFCLTPASKSSPACLQKLERWLTSLRLKVEITSPEAHDRSLAKLSHILQILLIALGAETASNISDQELQQLLKFAGPSFQQISRLLSSPYELWQQISRQNQEVLSELLSAYIARLTSLQAAISNGDNQVLQTNFEQSAMVAKALAAPTK